MISGNHGIPGGRRIPSTLEHAFHEIASMLELLRSSRDALERATSDDFRLTTEKLEEVTSATEVAATGLLDGLDCALQQVDRLEALDISGNAEAAEARNALRDALFQSVNQLQFQDITSQQLRHTMAVLKSLETRLASVRSSFDAYLSGAKDATDVTPSLAGIRPTHTAFDPDASFSDSSSRQALVDELLRPSE